MVRRIRHLRTRVEQKNKTFTDERRIRRLWTRDEQKNKAFTGRGTNRRIRRLRTRDEQKKKAFTDDDEQKKKALSCAASWRRIAVPNGDFSYNNYMECVSVVC